MTKDDSARAMLDEERRPAPPSGPSSLSPTPVPTTHLVTIDGDLIREVSRVQHDKTLQAVRDLIDGVPKIKPKPARRWDHETVERTAAEVLADIRAALIELRGKP